MRRLRVSFLWVLCFASLACTPPPPSVPAAGADPSAPGDRLDEQEARVAEAVARAREHVMTLEFTIEDGKSEAPARRVATGVVVWDDGRGRDVISVRVAPPPSGVPVVARDAVGRRTTARWVADDPETGLTLLRVDDDSAYPRRATAPLPLPPGLPRLGSQVLVIGNPFGLGHSVTRGSISALDRRLDLGARPLGGLIQIDAAFHPGDNGALVATLRGEWLGLVRSGLAPRGTDPTRDHDLGFALPARDALWVADRLRARGRVDRAYLGIRLALRPSNEGPGAVLDSVLDDTPAARVGLKNGDRVVTLDGHDVASPHDLTDRLDRTPADADVVVEYYRGPVRDRRVIRTASRPPSERDRDADAPAPTRPDSPRVLKEQIERLERRLEELERALAKEKAPPSETHAESGAR